MGMPGMVNPMNFMSNPAAAASAQSLNPQQPQNPLQQSNPQQQFTMPWNPMMANPAAAAKVQSQVPDMSGMQRMPGMPDVNAQLANYAAMMAAMNPAAFGANPAMAANPFLFQQMLAANPMYAQMMAMMGGANPAAMGYDFSWLNGMRNQQAAAAAAASQNPHMNPNQFDQSRQATAPSMHQMAPVPGVQKKMSSQSLNPNGPQNAISGMPSIMPPMPKKNIAPNQGQRLPTGAMMPKTQVPLARGGSPGVKAPAVMRKPVGSLLSARDPKLDGAGKPDMFKKQLQSEKRKGLNPCSLHVALARSIAKARDVITPDEVRPQSQSQGKSKSVKGSMDESGVEYHRDGGIQYHSESSQVLSHSLPTQQTEEIESAGGTEETEEEGNIDDLAAAATLASAFASQPPVNSQRPPQVTLPLKNEPSRSPSRKRSAGDFEPVSSEESSAKRLRAKAAEDSSQPEAMYQSQDEPSHGFSQPRQFHPPQQFQHPRAQPQDNQDLVGRSIRFSGTLASENWKEALVCEYDRLEISNLFHQKNRLLSVFGLRPPKIQVNLKLCIRARMSLLTVFRSLDSSIHHNNSSILAHNHKTTKTLLGEVLGFQVHLHRRTGRRLWFVSTIGKTICMCLNMEMGIVNQQVWLTVEWLFYSFHCTCDFIKIFIIPHQLHPLFRHQKLLPSTWLYLDHWGHIQAQEFP
eukprot:TRINITY_DN10770_c0_g1_i4.p1 TRINITY_DN10770_c0_g1~~TRINITY_DN10770_c0_g1_i4.p1  ORF type:complete len:749 (+),score=127.70 TRINITY_DN10770_c0_g1_i4:183-2249(+)